MGKVKKHFKSISLNVNSAYFTWLYDLVDIGEDYLFLLGALFTSDFEDLIPNDSNRVSDGLMLRDIFMDNSFYELDNSSKPNCSVFELLIGVSYRLENMTDGYIMKEWFWKLIENLDLDRFTDTEYYTFGGPKKVEEIIENFSRRRHKSNGFGGIFPLNKPRKDQRKVEIWYQMCAYLDENYSF